MGAIPALLEPADGHTISTASNGQTTVLREHMADKEKQEALVKASRLDWTLVQPVGLTDGPPTRPLFALDRRPVRLRQASALPSWPKGAV